MALNLSALCLRAQVAATQPSATSAPIHEDPAEPAVKTGQGGQSFLARHESFLKRKSEGPIEVLFLGDSITAGWAGPGKNVWAASYAGYQPANFGIGGDRTQHVLWRIANGELDGLHPQVTILMIGTNNLGSDSADNIAKADTKIVQQIRDETASKVLLLAIFPRDSRFDNARTMVDLREVNEALAKLDNGDTIRYLDIGKVFFGPGGKVNKDIMPDGLHPNAQGYQLWADAMRPLFEQMTHKPTTKP